MERVQEWVRSLICCFCLIQVIEQILPNGTYRKYVRFFCGLLLLLLTISPLVGAAGLSEKLEQEWRQNALKEEWASLHMEQEELLQFRRQTIRQACKTEIERQIAEVAKGHGIEEAEVEAEFALYGEDTFQIESVRISGICRQAEKAAAEDAVKEELRVIYQIGEEKIELHVRE